jgi:L-threonylcarbamoyladenylate synthase
MIIQKQSNKIISGVVKFLEEGGVIICPTDTIYGFLALAENKKAVNKVYKIKNRPKSKPLPVFIKDFKMVKSIAEIDTAKEKITKKYWPGKYTFVLQRKKGIKIYDGTKDTIALRIPKYKFLISLLKKINKPLVQTSVNVSDSQPLTKSADIINQFNKVKDLLFIDAGNLPKAKSSTIIDLTKSNILILRK